MLELTQPIRVDAVNTSATCMGSSLLRVEDSDSFATPIDQASLCEVVLTGTINISQTKSLVGMALISSKDTRNSEIARARYTCQFVRIIRVREGPPNKIKRRAAPKPASKATDINPRLSLRKLHISAPRSHFTRYTFHSLPSTSKDTHFTLPPTTAKLHIPPPLDRNHICPWMRQKPKAKNKSL